MLSDYFLIKFFLAGIDKDDEFQDSNKVNIPGSFDSKLFLSLSTLCAELHYL